ncbi:MAG: cytochrome P450 [Kiloniellales bacterium]|nr:cytochrome P450 [Kiloniellales bacterium]
MAKPPKRPSGHGAASTPSGDTTAAAREVAARFDPLKLPDSFYEDPFPTYHALRTWDPVHRCADGSVFLTRYDDLLAIYKDAKRFSSDKKKEFGPKYGPTPLFEHHTTSLVFNDPPLHTRVRRLIAGALTPAAIARMEPDLVRLVDRLLDRAQDEGRLDLIDDFAGAIPVEVIGNLLDVPQADRGPLRGWSLAILGALEATISEEVMARGNAAVVDFLDYLRGLVAERRRKPGDPRSDVLTRLIQGEADGEQLTETELLQNCIFILNAGHETTSNLIGNGLVALATWPRERRRLIEDPGLIKTAVEEVLRFESSNQLGNRITTEPVEIGDVEMPAETRITLCIGAANRDPAHFPDPDRFDIARAPNRHLAFGAGPHVCAGLSLARLEGQVAVGRFVARFPGYELAEPPRRARRARFRGFVSAPAVVTP